MNTAVRIVAGTLRGRKIACSVHADLRPTPQMVREALFSILGNAVPHRLFIDVFAGTGVVGLEALSRGAAAAYFIERDLRLASAMEEHLRRFGFARQGRVYRTDAYRWIAAWKAPAEPVNVFLSPPFADLHAQPQLLIQALARLQDHVAVDSVVILQSERGAPIEAASELTAWEQRVYGRNVLWLWQKEAPAPTSRG
ncbi:MAG: RsmD family RNA methyltransferase [Gemmataceae bacterium]|nr:RsmD family RNA methyltransferase [Gemmataceae bacterium]